MKKPDYCTFWPDRIRFWPWKMRGEYDWSGCCLIHDYYTQERPHTISIWQAHMNLAI